jgi:ion channel-forming bestrophin family protein
VDARAWAGAAFPVGRADLLVGWRSADDDGDRPMLIEERPTWLRLVFKVRGSAFPRVWKRVAFITLLSVVFTRLQRYPEFHISLSMMPFLIVGLPLGIILGFRNNAAYDRYWEGRKLWGALVNVSRAFTRQLTTLVEGGPDRDIALRVVAFAHALRMQLRGERAWDELRDLLPAAEISAFEHEPNPAAAIVHRTGEKLRAAYDAGRIDKYFFPVLEGSLSQMNDIQGGCERIKKTPTPLGYAIFIHRAVAAYCFLLPFGIEDSTHELTPVVAFFIAYAFFSLDAIGDTLDDPFRVDQHHLPLTSLCRGIEIYVRARLGQEDLPPAIAPRGDVLD